MQTKEGRNTQGLMVLASQLFSLSNAMPMNADTDCSTSVDAHEPPTNPARYILVALLAVAAAAVAVKTIVKRYCPQPSVNREQEIHLLEQQIQADAKRTQRIEHEFNSIFTTLKRLKQQFYTEQGKQIDALWQSFSESERKAIIEAADSRLICPITKELLREPVVPADGRHYERYSLQQWYDAYGQSCPYDRTKTLTIPTALPVDADLQMRVLTFLQEQQHEFKAEDSPDNITHYKKLS